MAAIFSMAQILDILVASGYRFRLQRIHHILAVFQVAKLSLIYSPIHKYRLLLVQQEREKFAPTNGGIIRLFRSHVSSSRWMFEKRHPSVRTLMVKYRLPWRKKIILAIVSDVKYWSNLKCMCISYLSKYSNVEFYRVNKRNEYNS